MHEICSVVDDIKYLRSVLERVQRERMHGSSTGGTLELLIQAGALSVSGALLLYELRDSGMPTHVMLLSASEPWFAALALGVAGIGLLLLTLCLYSVLLYGAMKEKEELSDYMARNFRRFARLSFCSDLFTKFVCFAFVILAGGATWIPPLLLVFTADYLFQGRLFLYSARLSVLFGALCLVSAALQAASGVPSLVPAAALFSLLACGSTVIAARELKRVKAGQGADVAAER